MACVLEQMKKDAEGFSAEEILLGDFNARPQAEAIALCRQALTDVTEHIAYSFHAFGLPERHSKIDYIFVSKELVFRVEKAETWTDCHEGIYLSDHYPLCAIFN